MKTLIKIFVTALVAVAMSFLTGCGTTGKLQKAPQDFGSGKNFFEAYGIKTEGTYVSGRIISAEDLIFEGNYTIRVRLENGEEFMLANDGIYKCYSFSYIGTEEARKLHQGEPGYYDAETVKTLYVEAIVLEGISNQFVYCNYDDHQRALDFMKNGAKTKTEKSSLEISDYKKNEIFGNPTKVGKSKVLELVEYFGPGKFTNYYLSDGTVLTLSLAAKEYFCDRSRKSIEKGDVVSYVLSDMTGSNTREYNPYTNTLDYMVE